MNIYLLSQSDNRGYDTYDSCVVYAESEELARLITPNWSKFTEFNSSWASCPENVKVHYLGVAMYNGVPECGIDSGLILASFNAG